MRTFLVFVIVVATTPALSKPITIDGTVTRGQLASACKAAMVYAATAKEQAAAIIVAIQAPAPR